MLERDKQEASEGSLGHSTNTEIRGKAWFTTDITQITIRSDLLSQIRGRAVTLRDQIHRELRHTRSNSYVIKLGQMV